MRIWIKINTCKLLPVLFLLVLFTLGCGLLGEEEKVRPAPQRQSKKVEKQSMPAVFQRMEDAALDLYHLPGGDWSQAMQGLNKLKSLWQQGEQELDREKVPAEQRMVVKMHLAGLEAAIKNRSLFKMREHANEITGALPDLTKKFKTVIPAELLKMEAARREIALHVTVANWQTAGSLVKKAPDNWRKFKPQGEKVGAKEVGKNLENSLKELEEAIKVKDQQKAQQLITMVEADLADLRLAFAQNSQG